MIGIEARICAIPLVHVVETMRPRPIEPMASSPPFVLGLSVVRGAPIPVVDLGMLIGSHGAAPTRFVTLRTDDRRCALAVDSVVGVDVVDAHKLETLPPLLGDANANVIEAIAPLDARLLVVLRTARIVTNFGASA